jgi:AcrR family transcriptional regulator
MRQFWRTGYETTSIAELTAAMGITTPSLYTAFGDKETLFLECLARYKAPSWPSPESLMQSATAKEAAQRMLEGSARWFTQPGMPPGCLIVSAATSDSASSEQVQTALRNVRRDLKDMLCNRITQDILSGTLPSEANAETLSSLTVAVMHGLAALARDGASRAELLAIAKTALQAWPTT